MKTRLTLLLIFLFLPLILRGQVSGAFLDSLYRKIYIKGLQELSDENYSEAERNLAIAANVGNISAQNELGLLYLNGDMLKRDTTLAIYWLERSASAGNNESMDLLGWVYGGDKIVTQNNAKSLDWYKKSAALGSALAKANLGFDYFYGKGVDINYAIALEFFKESAGQKNADAEFYVGYMLANGYGVTKNLKLAFDWYLRSAEGGCTSGQKMLGQMYVNGDGGVKDVAKGVQLIYNAAQQGEEDAVKELKYLYKNNLVKEITGIRSLDSTMLHPLRRELTIAEKEIIQKKALTCFPINETIGVKVTVQDLLPSSQLTLKKSVNSQELAKALDKLKLTPDNFQACLSVAEMYLKLYRKDEAFHYFDKAATIANATLKNQPQDSLQFWNLGHVYLRKEDYEKALTFLQAYARSHSSDSVVDNSFLCQMALGEFSKAQELLIPQIQRNPLNMSHQFEFLFADLTQLVKKDFPGSLEFENAGHHRLQSINLDKRIIDPEEIERDLDFRFLSDAMLQFPDTFRLHCLKRAFQAMALFLNVVTKAQQDSSFQSNKRFVLSNHGIKEVEILKQFWSNSLLDNRLERKYTSLSLLAALFMISNDSEEAIRYGELAILEKENEKSFAGVVELPDAYDRMVGLYWNRMDTLKAMQMLEKRILAEKEEVDPKDFSRLAKFNLWRGDVDKAIENCKKAIAIDRFSADAYVGLATSYVLEGDYKTAKENLLKALYFGDENVNTKTLCGIIWMEVGQYKSAFQCFQEVARRSKGHQVAKDLAKDYFFQEQHIRDD